LLTGWSFLAPFADCLERAHAGSRWRICAARNLDRGLACIRLISHFSSTFIVYSHCFSGVGWVIAKLRRIGQQFNPVLNVVWLPVLFFTCFCG